MGGGRREESGHVIVGIPAPPPKTRGRLSVIIPTVCASGKEGKHETFEYCRAIVRMGMAWRIVNIIQPQTKETASIV